MTTMRRKTDIKKKEKSYALQYDNMLVKKQYEDSMHFKINLHADTGSAKPQLDKNIDPTTFQSNTKLNFILTPQLQSQQHNTIPLIADDSIHLEKNGNASNNKKQSSVTAKTRNTYSGFMVGCLTSRGKKSETTTKQFISRQTNSYNITKYFSGQIKENINEKKQEEVNKRPQPLSDIELRKKQLNEKLQMLSSQKPKPPTPLQESIDSCNVVNSSSEYSDTTEQGKKHERIDSSAQEYRNVHELEIIPIQDYNNEKEDNLLNDSFHSDLKIKDAKDDILSDSYNCLKACVNALSKIKEISNEMSELRDDNDILDDEKVLRWHISVGMLKEFSKTLNFQQFESTLGKMEKSINSNTIDIKKESVRWTNGSTEASNSILYKKYEKQIDKLKEENSKLADRNKELEDAWKSVAEPIA